MAVLKIGGKTVVPAIIKKASGEIPSYIAPKNNVNGVYKPDNTATTFNVNGATDVDVYALAYAFQECTNLTSVNLSSLTTINASNAMSSCFGYCTNLTSIDLSSLTTINGNNAIGFCFGYCTNLTSIDLSSLTTINSLNVMNSCFYYCVGLTSVDLSSLTTISGSNAMYSCFQGCTKLTSVSFPALRSFGTSTLMVNQFDNMLSGITGCTLHFPSNMQSEVERRTGYPNFGGTNTVILFDLPATTA